MAKQLKRDIKLLEEKNFNLDKSYKEIKQTMEHFTAEKNAEL